MPYSEVSSKVLGSQKGYWHGKYIGKEEVKNCSMGDTFDVLIVSGFPSSKVLNDPFQYTFGFFSYIWEQTVSQREIVIQNWKMATGCIHTCVSPYHLAHS